MYNIGDYVVCPGHGVGQICDSEARDSNTYYIIKILSNGMKVMIPESNEEGLRTLVGDSEIEEVFSLLKTHDVELDNSTWNRRH